LDPGECGATTVDSGGGRFDDEEGRWRSPSLRGTARHLKRQTEDGGGVLLWAARGGGGGAQDQRSAARRSTMASSRPAIGAGGGRRPRRRERWSCGGAWRPGARRRGLDDGGGGSPEATAATAQAPRRRGEPPRLKLPFLPSLPTIRAEGWWLGQAPTGGDGVRPVCLWIWRRGGGGMVPLFFAFAGGVQFLLPRTGQYELFVSSKLKLGFVRGGFTRGF
jgi:hypothetical protein